MNELIPFDYQGFQVTTMVDERDGTVFFHRNEVCVALGYKNQADATRFLSDKYLVGVAWNDPHGRIQETTFLTEPGLYRLLMRCTLPAATPFQEWLAETVLPTIRKTGKYEIPKPVPQLTPLDEHELLERRYEFLVRLGMADDRDRLMFADAIRTSMTKLLPQHAESLQPKGFFVSERVAALGYHLTRKQETAFVMKLGRQIAEEYRSRYGCEPRTSSKFVDGAVRPVKWYTDDDASWIDTIIQTFFAGFPGITREEDDAR